MATNQTSETPVPNQQQQEAQTVPAEVQTENDEQIAKALQEQYNQERISSGQNTTYPGALNTKKFVCFYLRARSQKTLTSRHSFSFR